MECECFARNRYDSARYKTQLKRNGVKLVSATEVISAGPEGIILESVLEGYAEYYSADLSEKVVRGMTENALKGIYNGGTIPFGYMIDETRHYQPDPLLAPYVEQTFQKYVDGATMTDLRDWLKAHNIKNSMGGEMSYNEKQLKETELGITNMLNAIQMGILTSSTKERLEALEDQRKELQARIAEERLAKPKMKEEFVRFWLLRFRKLDMTQPEQRQALVDTFINAIYLYDDKVLITFNYKEGTETVAFGEAVKAEKSSDMSARGAPDIKRKIVRFDVLSLCRKAAAHFLHTVCTFARIRGFSAQGLHSLLSFA